MKGRVQSTRPVDLVVKRIFQCVKFSREKIFLLDLLKMMYNYLWKKLNTVKVQILSILYYINNLQILLNLNFARNFNFTRKGYSILWNSLLFFFKRWISKPKSVPRHFWARVYLRAHAIPMHPHLFFFFFLAISVYTPEGYVSDEASSSRTNSILRLGESV